MNGVLAWLAGLPAPVLYLALALCAAVENVFPPLPTDTVVAFGTWLATRAGQSALIAFAVSWVGNVAGAAGMYIVGRRHGSAFIRRRFPSLADDRSEERLRQLYARWGVLALVVSRFIPGVRALVPPFAGALHVPAAVAVGAMAVASAIWYGFIAYAAYTAGTDWDAITRLIARSGRVTALVALALVAVGAAIWLLRRRRRPAG